jgi:hypothetical protein
MGIIIHISYPLPQFLQGIQPFTRAVFLPNGGGGGENPLLAPFPWLRHCLSQYVHPLIIIIKFSSRFLYLPSTPTYSETAAEIFCKTIWSGWSTFDLGYISIYTCVSLTIERWIAVVKPNKYRSLKRKHGVLAVLFVWICGIAANASVFLRIKYDPVKNLCRWAPFPFAAKVFPWIDLTVQSIIPYTTMVALYTHIYFRMKSLPQISSNSDPQLKKVTIVAVLTCSALILGWLPGRITFMLSKFGYVNTKGILHNSFIMMTFCNSCANPVLYGMCNSRFRAEYKNVLNKVLTLCGTSVSPSSSTPVPDSTGILHLPRSSVKSDVQRGTHEQSTL